MTNAVNLASAAGTGFAFRNRIINGDMRIDQRYAGASATYGVGSVYYLDRWLGSATTAGVMNVGRSTDAPEGFTNSFRAASQASYTVASGSAFYQVQPIEGFNIADFDWGKSTAKTVTLSFWVKSSITGTHSGSIRNTSPSLAYPFTYAINAANTWEYKTVTIPGPTTGTWTTDNTAGLWLFFDLGSGSSLRGTAGSWQSGNFVGVTGAVTPMATNGATWFLTGVQLEVGSVATPFERRPYGLELALCQRYFAKTYPIGTVPGTVGSSGAVLTTCFATIGYAGGTWALPVQMRANPTVVAYSVVNSNTTGKITSDATDGNGLGNTNSPDRVTFYRNNDSSGIGISTFLQFHATASAEF